MIIALLSQSIAIGSTITVGAGGDYASLRTAIAVSSDGDRIEVAPGTYTESIQLGFKDVEVVATDGPDVTFLVGDGAAPAVMVTDEATSATALDGFTVVGTGQRCIEIDGGEPRLANLYMGDCGGDDVTTGGAIRIRGGAVTLEDVVVQDVAAQRGGAIDCTNAGMTIVRSTFQRNEARTGDGGALLIDRCETALSAVTFEGNRAAMNGGAVSGSFQQLSVTEGSVFRDNHATYGRGGGIDWAEASEVSLDDARFEGNSARNAGGGVRLHAVELGLVDSSTFDGNATSALDSLGGGFHATDSTVTLESVTLMLNHAGAHGGGFAATNCTVNAVESHAEQNHADGLGGAVFMDGGILMLSDSTIHDNVGINGGGGVTVQTNDLILARTSLDRNQSPGGPGGALLTIDSNASLDRVDLRGNTALVGGGLFMSGTGTQTVRHSVFQENEASFEGGGIYLTGTMNVEVRANTFVANETRVTDSVAHAAFTVGSIDFRNNLFVHGRNGFGVGAGTAAGPSPGVFRHNNTWGNESGNYASIADPTGFDGNISVDPRFVELSIDQNFENDDLHLQRDSPCVDAGDPETVGADDPPPAIGAFGVTGIPDEDEDGDGYAPEGGGDCNDADPTVHPGTDELCGDGVDNNCDGVIDEGCPSDTGESDEDTGRSDDTGNADSAGDADTPEARSEDTGTQPAGLDRAYEIDGSGCRCSMTPAVPRGALALAFPILFAAGRRRS